MELEAALKKYDKTGMASWTWYLDVPGLDLLGKSWFVTEELPLNR